MINDKNKKHNEEELEEQEVVSEETDDECGKIKEENVLLQEKTTELEAQVKRILADYQNAQKRMRDEKSQWIKIANKELLLRLLPVLDTLMLASKHSEDKTLHVTLQQFLDVLSGEDVKRIITDGKNFDPKHMECIEVVEGKEGIIVDETRAGFLYHDTVLRPAQVRVGKGESIMSS